MAIMLDGMKGSQDNRMTYALFTKLLEHMAADETGEWVMAKGTTGSTLKLSATLDLSIPESNWLLEKVG